MNCLPLCSVLATSVFLLFAEAAAQSAPSMERVSRVAQHYAAKDGFTGTVTFASSGKILFQHGYGLATRNGSVPFKDRTRFDIGSISKQFTAAAILLLQEQGKLRTSDRLAQLLPAEDISPQWSKITLRQLLSHTSGLKDYTGFLSMEMSREHTPSELLAAVKNEPLSFKPGERFDYSNTNYLLLGLVVQKVSGMPYCRFLRERIFPPLHMRDTQCLGEAGALERHATGYAPEDPGEGKPLATDPPVAKLADSFYFGAGSLISDGADLVRWTSSLHHGGVLSEASYREMTTPVRDSYGYGLQIGTLRGHMRLDHAGSVPGFYSELEYFPETDNTVVVLSNQNALAKGQFTPGTHEIDSELMTVAAIPNASVPSEGKEVVVSPRVLRLFTGRYVAEDGKQAPFTISLSKDHLELLQDGLGHSPSILRGDYGDLDFFLADTEADLEFSGQNEAVIFDLRYSKAVLFHRVQADATEAPQY